MREALLRLEVEGLIKLYQAAIIFRTSLGVAGLDAADRFDVNASALSTFSILQLLVYAGMQIPVGLMVDRLGTKRVLTIGAVLFTVGQLGFALSPSYGMALAARALLRLRRRDDVHQRAAARQPLVPGPARAAIGQVAALFGMAGNLVSTLFIARALHSYGWTTTFVGSSLAEVVVLVPLLLFLKDHPEGHEPPPAEHAGATYVRRQIAAAWRVPGRGWGCGCTSPPSSRRWCSCCCGGCRSWSRRGLSRGTGHRASRTPCR
ncbi:hypothetical protein SCALM49S_08897 [Streptomyces californicus]